MGKNAAFFLFFVVKKAKRLEKSSFLISKIVRKLLMFFSEVLGSVCNTIEV
jgi:hypothetical protein